MGYVAAIQAVIAIVTYVNNQQEENHRKAQMKELLNDVANIAKLLEGMKDVIKQMLQEQTIDDQHAQLSYAYKKFASAMDNGYPNPGPDKIEVVKEEMAEATTNAAKAAVRLMEDDVKVEAALTFLAAAGFHISILVERAKAEPAMVTELYKFAPSYTDHVEAIVPLIEARTANRITISREPNGRFDIFIYNRVLLYDDVYRIDGREISRKQAPLIELHLGISYYEEKRLNDAHTLAAPITFALRMAAEAWRAIVAPPAVPNYGGVFGGIFIGAQDTPYALVTQGKRINFGTMACARHFSKIFFAVPTSVFDAIPYAGDIADGAVCLDAPDRPGAFVLRHGQNENQLVLIDSAAAVADNHSNIQTVKIEEWETHGVFTTCHVDPYENL